MTVYSGTHFKIIWANQHLEKVQTMCREYVGADPYAFPTHNADDFVVVYPPVITNQPFLDIGGHIGDCLTNSMAVLDYTIWHLAGKHAGRTLAPPQSGLPKPAKGGWDTPTFPLYIDRDEFAAASLKFDRYNFPRPVWEALMEVQPFNAGYEPLGLLYRLVNQDKHRDRIYTIGEVGTPDDLRILNSQGIVERPISSTAEAAVFPAPYPKDTPFHQRQVKVQTKPPTRVTWTDPTMPREPVDITLYQIVKTVVAVYHRFSALM